MELLRTSLLTAVSTAIRLVSAFAVNKVVAVAVGPPGMALMGQIQSVSSILLGVSSGLFGTAAVKYSAEWKEQPQRLLQFLSLSYVLVFWITLTVGSGTAALSWWLARTLLNDPAYWWVFALLGLTIPLFATNSLVLSVITGLGDVRKLTLINVGQSLLGLLVSIGLPLAFGLPGALAATVLSSAIVFVLLIPELKQHEWLRLRGVALRANVEDFRRLGSFAVMALTAAVCVPLAQLLVRNWILDHCSIQEAGYWQGLTRLSSAYLLFFTTTLSVYFLPKYSASDAAGIKRSILKGYAIMLPTLAVVFISIWLARGLIVPLLFSAEFGPMQGLLVYQLAGDFLKIGSWLLTFLILARARTALYIASEVVFGILYVILSILMIGRDGAGGVRGALIAWSILYAVYWGFLVTMLPYILRGKDR